MFGDLPEHTISVHLDCGYDSRSTREKLEDHGLLALISEKGKNQLLFRRPFSPGSGEDEFVAQRLQEACVVYGEARKGGGLLGGLLRGGHHRKEAHSRRIESLPLGRPSLPPTVA